MATIMADLFTADPAQVNKDLETLIEALRIVEEEWESLKRVYQNKGGENEKVHRIHE